MVDKVVHTLFTFPNIITGIISLFVSFVQLSMDSKHDDKKWLVIKHFSLAARSASGFKLIVTACQAIHVEGSEFYGAACWFSFVLQAGVIWFHLDEEDKSWTRMMKISIAIIVVAGTSLLFLQFLFPRDWHTIVVPVINIIVIPLEAIVQLAIQISTFKSNTELEAEVSYKTLACNLLLKSVETAISMYRWNNFAQQTQDKSGAEKFLSMVGGYSALLIRVIQFGWILCKSASILYKKINQVSDGQEMQTTEIATEPNEDGNAEEQVTGEEETGAEVAMNISNVEEPVVGKEEMAAEVAIDIGKTEEQMVGEEEMAAEVVVEVGGVEEQVTGKEENVAEVAVEVEEDVNAHKQATEEGMEQRALYLMQGNGLKRSIELSSAEKSMPPRLPWIDVGVEMVAILPLTRG